jgi:phosphoglycerate dehydrogenase-like enzyme
MLHKLLVASDLVKGEDIRKLERHAEVFNSKELSPEKLDSLLPEVDAMIVFSWPQFLTAEALEKMHRLRFIQSILVGVNHVLFSSLEKRVTVCSNSGAYSPEVAEHAMALLLAAAKRITEHHSAISAGASELGSFAGAVEDIMVLRGKKLGVVGFGGIGKEVASLGNAIGMTVLAYTRSRKKSRGVKFYYGKGGLGELLRNSDAVVLAVPLTNSTMRLIGEKELSLMKERAILVNIARGDLVDQEALYQRLRQNKDFTYATDVWWFKEGKESLRTDYPLATLPNFVGTPHTSGPTGLLSGRPARFAVDNTLRYLKGMKPRNVVDRSEYLSPT